MPASNGRFGASGGVGSSESEQITSSFALVQAFAIPSACAKPLGRCTQAGATVQQDNNSMNRKQEQRRNGRKN
ncbi:MAG: hypothetical protein FWC10_09385 [Lentimicrobiaceae bacterium]|nr:hypothetical protein [Lentimicrobiaceae bacterium]